MMNIKLQTPNIDTSLGLRFKNQSDKIVVKLWINPEEEERKRIAEEKRKREEEEQKRIAEEKRKKEEEERKRIAEEKRKREEEERKKEMEELKKNLLKQKSELLNHRKNLALLKEKVNQIVSGLINNPQKANREMLRLLKDNTLLKYEASVEYKTMLFYIYKHNHLTDKMLEVSHEILKNSAFSENDLQLYYDLAVLHENAGDPVVAKKIYRQFIDNLFLDFEDVTERYNQLK